jgi:hypothetical protein
MEFHSSTRALVRHERSARLLYGEVKIDGAYQRQAERHIREIVKFIQECREVEAYLKRKAAT